MKTIIVKVRGEAKDIVRSRSPKKAIERLMKRWPTATFGELVRTVAKSQGKIIDGDW